MTRRMAAGVPLVAMLYQSQTGKLLRRTSMRKAVALAMLTCAAAALTSNNSYAKNPLLDGVTGTAVMAEKDLASVKGSGFTAAYYSYLGGYYLAYAQLYANYGNYYNSAGYTNSTYGSYFNLAANNAYNAYYYYNIARQN